MREAILEIKEPKLLSSEAKSEVGFAKVPAAALSSVSEKPVTTVNVKGIKIDVYEDASEEAVRKSIKAVMSLC